MQHRDEEALRARLHAALDDVTLGGVEFQTVARAARRRHRKVMAFGTVAAAVAVASVLAGVNALAGPAGGAGGLVAGAGGSPSPLDSSSPSPLGSARPTPSAPGSAAYCPAKASGTIQWPSIDDPWINGGDSSPPPSFTADQAFICRYEAGGSGQLVGSAHITDRHTVRQLQSAMSAPHPLPDNPCKIDSIAFLWFTQGNDSKIYNLDLTSCNVWLMPDATAIDGPLADQIRALTPKSHH
jgi:hypothetical protein